MFHNEGTVVKVAGTGVTTFAGYYRAATPLHNRGVVEVRSGALQLNGTDTHTGSFVMATNATLHLANGTHAFELGSIIGGEGRLLISVHTVNVSTNLSVGSVVELTGGTLQGGGVFEVEGPMTFSGGTLQGALGLNVRSNLVWTGGVMTGSGVTQIGTNGTLTVEGGAEKHLSRVMNNLGRTLWSGGRWWAVDGVFQNAAGAACPARQ